MKKWEALGKKQEIFKKYKITQQNWVYQNIIFIHFYVAFKDIYWLKILLLVHHDFRRKLKSWFKLLCLLIARIGWKYMMIVANRSLHCFFWKKIGIREKIRVISILSFFFSEIQSNLDFMPPRFYANSILCHNCEGNL